MCFLASRHHDAHFHYVSTDEVYGDFALDSLLRFAEDSFYRPSSPRSSTKASEDMLMKTRARMYGLCATISNSCNNSGSR